MCAWRFPSVSVASGIQTGVVLESMIKSQEPESREMWGLAEASLECHR